MEKNAEFDDIRPYYDDEVISVIERLVNNPEFKRVINFVFPETDWGEFVAYMRSFKSKRDFQHNLIAKTVFKITERNAASIECAGLENIKEEVSYTYISNHRDILLDASLLSSLLALKGYDTTEIAIGDNLLMHPWIEDLVRLNKSFIVKRSVSIRQMLEVSAHLSKYIHFAIKDKHESVWIAQREGRAKDSDDRTQESLLKMLGMGGNNDFIDNIKELNIIPVSFSYEYDPCDYLKAEEFQQKRDNPEFKKSQADDLLSMETGLFGYKGNIHFQFGCPINPLLEQLDASLPKNELVAQVASIIDKEIFFNYKFYPGNYIAYDRLWGKDYFVNKYSGEDIKIFDAYLSKQLERVELENKDIPFLTEKILEMYANPVKNQLQKE
jgi:hypothetical protein